MEFESLLMDEEFIRRLNESPINAERFVEDLCQENPEKEEAIRMAAQLVSRYKSERQYVDDEKLDLMLNNILSNWNASKRARLNRFAPVWQIAAASVAIVMSLTVYFYESSRNNSIKKFAQEKVAIADEARIIISDGSEYRLESNNSLIKYGSDGSEIVIENKNNQIKKLTNKPAETSAILNQIVVPYGSRHTITLSDGTVVRLNSGSKLVFPAKFSETKREVYLKGEGYFEVTKDQKKSFVVKTDFMNVKVLGTHFNISAYENEESASAVLVEGSIEVYNNKFFNSNLCKIKPGQGCFFTGVDSKFRIENVDVNEYVSWKDGFYQIKDKSFGSITKKVEKYYNKRIDFKDNELAHRIISGKLVLDPNLSRTLDFLAKTTKSKHILNDDGIYVFVKKN